MENEYYEYCKKEYLKEYQQFLQQKQSTDKGNGTHVVPSDDVDREAQKSAIRKSFVSAMRQFPKLPVEELWKSIYRAHLFRKSGISDLDTIQKVISADQSWKKSSGHAFEEMIKDLGNLALGTTAVEILLQKDLNTLIKAKELDNEPRDISWLKEQIKANIFDLFCVVQVKEKKYCFGCIQAKTRVRDRVTRDREPSIHAMQSFFWSTIIVLDGDFLRLPKFISMVNGGSDEFPVNGWHCMYVLSASKANGRIFPLDINFSIFRKHAVQAAKQWMSQRQWLDQNWMVK